MCLAWEVTTTRCDSSGRSLQERGASTPAMHHPHHRDRCSRTPLRQRVPPRRHDPSCRSRTIRYAPSSSTRAPRRKYQTTTTRTKQERRAGSIWIQRFASDRKHTPNGGFCQAERHAVSGNRYTNPQNLDHNNTLKHSVSDECRQSHKTQELVRVVPPCGRILFPLEKRPATIILKRSTQ